jgi:4'-phosphopantetheinyl transferase
MAAVLIPTTESPSIPPLRGREVLVWVCDLSQHESERTALATLLSPAEHIRANRFAFDRDRERFILSHGLLRVILSHYLAEPPGRIDFTMGLHGKPAIQPPADARSTIEFSLSHSGHYAVVAVANGRAVGVDVEVCRPDVEALSLAQRFFAPLESERIAQAHGQEQQRLFYRYWTGKEAYLKGRGIGLSLGLDRFELLFDDGLTQAQVRGTDSGGLDKNWSVQSLSIKEHVAGALAFEGEDCHVRMCMATSLFR